MIRKAFHSETGRVLAATAGVPALGPLCEMHWRLAAENPLLPGQFFFLENGSLLRLGGRQAMLCGPVDDAEELASFLQLSGVQQLSLLDNALPGWHQRENNAVMARPPGPAPDAPPLPGLVEQPSADAVLSVLESSGGRMQPEGLREGFWNDYNTRRNHGALLVLGIEQAGRLIATAGAYAVTPQACYIACVETLPQHRGKGYAGALMWQLLQRLPQRAHSLLCGDETTGFYTRFGFKNSGHRGIVCQNPAAL